MDVVCTRGCSCPQKSEGIGSPGAGIIGSCQKKSVLKPTLEQARERCTETKSLGSPWKHTQLCCPCGSLFQMQLGRKEEYPLVSELGTIDVLVLLIHVEGCVMCGTDMSVPYLCL